MENFLQIFNPDNAQTIKDEELAQMSTLSDDEIEQLGKAYPDNGRAPYLILRDSSITDDTKQLAQRSSWPILSDLRKKYGMKQFQPLTFVSKFNQAQTPVAQPTKTNDIAKDGLPGLVVAPLQTSQAVDGKNAVNGQETGQNEAQNENTGNTATNEGGQNLTGGEEFQDLSSEAAKAAGNTGTNQGAESTTQNQQGTSQEGSTQNQDGSTSTSQEGATKTTTTRAPRKQA